MRCSSAVVILLQEVSRSRAILGLALAYTMDRMGSLRLIKRHVITATSISLALWLLVPFEVWARLQHPPATIDLTRFTSTAPRIFRGLVVGVSVVRGNEFQVIRAARFKVERWYRGESVPEAMVHFETGLSMPGHDCIDFKPGTHWFIFANVRKAHLELVDDCYGAVGVSPIIAPVLQRPDMLGQIEADFTAGLNDSDRDSRLVSIQRLGGLKSLSSRPALHRVIGRGDSTEESWATYAALRSGDTTVLSRVRDMLVRGNDDVPSFFLAWELGQLKDRGAIPGLIEIVNSAPDSNGRKYALLALGENLQSSEAAPTIAARLADLDSGVRFSALGAMTVITHEPACRLPTEPRWTDDMVEPQIRQCLIWWNDSGKQRFSRQQQPR